MDPGPGEELGVGITPLSPRTDYAWQATASAIYTEVGQYAADLAGSEPSEIADQGSEYGSRPNTSATRASAAQGFSIGSAGGAGVLAGMRKLPELPATVPLPIRALRLAANAGHMSPADRGSLALSCRKGERAARLASIGQQQAELQRLNALVAERDNQVRSMRRENAAMWKSRWKRLEEVAEENRELRERGPAEKPGSYAGDVEEELAKPSFKDLPKPSITEEEVDEHLDTIARLNDSSLDKLVSPEICELKAAYAQFVTSWQSAVEVLPDEDVGLKLRLIGLAQSPTTWSAKAWCEAAVHAVAPTEPVTETGGPEEAQSEFEVP